MQANKGWIIPKYFSIIHTVLLLKFMKSVLHGAQLCIVAVVAIR